MHKKSPSTKLVVLCSFIAALVFSGTTGIVVSASDAKPVLLPEVPTELPPPEADGIIYLPGAGGAKLATTLDPTLQAHLTKFITDAKSPIAGIIVADAKTGAILAMAQGQSSTTWGGTTHSALHPSFPAASLFKTVVTAAAFEVAELDSNEQLALLGGCAHVRETGDWLSEKAPNARNRMSLRRAYGASCNGFFAKLAVNTLGIGIITQFAKRFGWDTGIPTDFQLDKSPFFPPSPQNSSTHTIGRFAAGFGYVGISAVHAAYTMLAIANDGKTLPIKLFRDTPVPDLASVPRIFSDETAQNLRMVMDATTHGGTASFSFGRGKYRKLRALVGGKTGTLTGNAPKGLTTWFAGLAPLEAPEIVVASVVILEDRWHIKGPSLAAEGFYAYFDQKLREKALQAANPTAAPLSDSTRPEGH